MSDMTPQEARDDLDWARAVARSEAGGGEWEDVLDYLVLALETIAPDLPEPDDVDPEREATWVTHHPAYTVYAYKHGLYGTWNVAMESAPGDLGPEDTRRLAYALLAAADYAEEEGTDDPA